MQGLTNPHLLRQACFINGEWVSAVNKSVLSVVNPVDQREIATVPMCGQAETRQAIEAAARAFVTWKQLTAKQRADYLWTWARLIDEHKEDLARLMTLEQGKPLVEARGEIDYANSFIKWFAEEARRVYGDVIASNVPGQHLIVLKQPIGVIAAITPWNFPAAMITRKIAPALAVGCTVVVKPAEETPLTALALAYLAEQAGLPASVLNVVTGNPEEIGRELTSNPTVRKLSFTGSTAVGKYLMSACAETLKKITLELGGNAPFIVFDDADLDAAVNGAIASKFRNSGQTCVCANRIYVQAAVYPAFVDKFTRAVQALQVGNGLEAGVQQGPLINEAAVSKVISHIENACELGANISTGGKRHSLGGTFFEPTVLTEMTAAMRIASEETFGPVAPIFKFTTEEELLTQVNATEFGLAGYFYSNSMSRVWRIAEALEVGMVGVNTGIISSEVAPFGGVKQSGMGREGSKYGVEPYVEVKYICMGSGA